jgi:DNA-binding beta-propeller fold protein YncE
MTTMKMVPLAALVLISSLGLAPSDTKNAHDTTNEVWSIDQSDSAGKSYGGTIYIWSSKELERVNKRAVAETVDLGGAAAALCLAQTGANPVRPHMLTMNQSSTHAIISFVASGHVLFMDARTRQPLTCIRTSVGSTGVRQVHQSFPSPDETYVAVANQNGKLYERINTDYSTNTFVLDHAARINLVTCTTPNNVPCQDANIRPDNAPICPIIESSGVLNFVTLRGGGLFVIDAKSTPMRIVAEYDKHTIHPNGCLGAQVGNKMYVDSGGGTAANLYEADLYAFPLGPGLYSAANAVNTPAPKVVFSEDVEGADSHGAALTKHGSYLWVADRGRNVIWVVDTATDEVVNSINLAPWLSPSGKASVVPTPEMLQKAGHCGHFSPDPTPDLLFLSPEGTHMFLSFRGPNPLSGDPHVSTGATPGVGVLKITEGGRNGVFEAIAPMSNKDAGGVQRADGHALWVRIVK